MTELLTKALDRIQGLPEDKQDRVAQIILDEVEAFEHENDNEKRQHKPVWEVIQEIFADITEEEWEKLPKDGAAELDHYLYGSPKKNS